jgi:hypothetical protein
MEVGKHGAKLLCKLTERGEEAVVAIARSKAFSGWTKTVTE